MPSASEAASAPAAPPKPCSPPAPARAQAGQSARHCPIVDRGGLRPAQPSPARHHARRALRRARRCGRPAPPPARARAGARAPARGREPRPRRAAGAPPCRARPAGRRSREPRPASACDRCHRRRAAARTRRSSWCCCSRCVISSTFRLSMPSACVSHASPSGISPRHSSFSADLQRAARPRQQRLHGLVRYAHHLAHLDLAHALVVKEGERQPLPLRQRLERRIDALRQARARPTAAPGPAARSPPAPSSDDRRVAPRAHAIDTQIRRHPPAATAARRLGPAPAQPHCAKAATASPAPRPRPPHRPAACAGRWPARSADAGRRGRERPPPRPPPRARARPSRPRSSSGPGPGERPGPALVRQHADASLASSPRSLQAYVQCPIAASEASHRPMQACR